MDEVYSNRYERWHKASSQAQASIRELVALGSIEWPYETERELADEVKSLRERLGGLTDSLELIAKHARLDHSERGIAEAERYALLAEDALTRLGGQ